MRKTPQKNNIFISMSNGILYVKNTICCTADYTYINMAKFFVYFSNESRSLTSRINSMHFHVLFCKFILLSKNVTITIVTVFKYTNFGNWWCVCTLLLKLQVLVGFQFPSTMPGISVRITIVCVHVSTCSCHIHSPFGCLFSHVMAIGWVWIMSIEHYYSSNCWLNFSQILLLLQVPSPLRHAHWHVPNSVWMNFSSLHGFN
jgi:hypothetical protein